MKYLWISLLCFLIVVYGGMLLILDLFLPKH